MSNAEPSGQVGGEALLRDEPGHSDIFDRLSAGEETDLVGLIAYGLYQRRKRAWMNDFHQKNGRFPSMEERHAYAFSHRGDACTALRGEAEGIMAAFAEQATEDRIQELRVEALGAETRAVLGIIDTKLGTLSRYRHHVIGHIMAILVLAGAVALLALIIAYEPSLEKVFHWVVAKIRD